MPIPGLKTLDDILAGLPTNAAQRKEIEELKKQITSLQEENDRLKEENSLLKKVTAGLFNKRKEEMVRIGGAYFKKGGDGKAMGYPYCVPCWESNKRLSSLSHMLADAYACPMCRNPSKGHFGWPAEAKG